MIDGGNARIISTSSNQTIVCIYINYHTFGSGRSSPFLRLCSNKWITISVSFTLLSHPVRQAVLRLISRLWLFYCERKTLFHG
jgi:hypothetical protein